MKIVVDMFDQARLKLRRARVSITSTEGMVVGAAGLIISICRILKGNQSHPKYLFVVDIMPTWTIDRHDG